MTIPRFRAQVPRTGKHANAWIGSFTSAGSVVGRGRSRRYPTALKAELLAAAASLREQGESWDRVAIALGVPAEWVLRWQDEIDVAASEPAQVPLVPVEVVGGVIPAVVMPTGVRVEGLSVDEIAALLKALS